MQKPPDSKAPPSPAEPQAVPILPLRNSVLFPMSVVPINVGRPRSVRLVEEVLGQERALVGVLSQRSPDVDEPSFGELYTVGTLARVVKVIRLGPNNYSVVLNGLGRLRVRQARAVEPFMSAVIERIPEGLSRDVEIDAVATSLREATREVLALMPNLPRDTASILDNVREPGALADLIASNFPQAQASMSDKQDILEALDLKTRLKMVLGLVQKQLEVLRVKKEISTMVHEEMGKDQREYVLRQQLKSIREELGEGGEDDEIDELREKVFRAKMPPEAEKTAKKQISRLRSMSHQSAEFNVTRNYVEWLADLPWSKTTTDKLDVEDVKRCLDEDHMGLEKVKKRIVEYIAVRQLRPTQKGPMLLFVGPPGVGKTSLGRSIARSMGRRYERIALGGVRDESEIRGHRRTYVSALPGRIIQALKKAGTRNPVIVLDELDKLARDQRGDPAAALLEVLDPEQNGTFVDHYIDLPFDLSQVTFLATANSYNIPGPLLDRMEVIDVAGYTRYEKMAIARDYLIPKQLSAHGLTDERLEFPPPGIEMIVDSYTREAGVRGLEREVAAVCRATAVKVAEGQDIREVATPEHVIRVLGPPRVRPERAELKLTPGVATGLGVTSAGGELLFVEVSKMPGKGNVVLTGNMKSVMQESAQTAISFVRSRADELHLDREWLKSIDLHLHLPRHGIPKDGPSAGIAIFSAVTSLLLGVPLRSDVAMTGEISLRGRVLPVGGIKQKLLAAHRAGIHHVLIPERNRADLDDVPEDIKKELRITLVSKVDEILSLVLEPPTAPAEVAPAVA